NNENTLSSSDDEEDPSRLSIATPPIPTVENERSRAIRETASTPLVTMKKLSNNTKSTKSTSISSSKKLASAHQQENAVDKIQQSKKHHSTDQIDCVHNKIELMIFNMRSNRYIEYEVYQIDCVHNKIELMIFNMRSNRYIEYEVYQIDCVHNKIELMIFNMRSNRFS
ncbi:unnamed protein product, partial [Rotaria socialis]